MGTVRFFRNSTRLFRYHVPTEFVVLAVIEFLALVASLYLALEIRFGGDGWQQYFGSFTLKALLYAVVMQLSLIAFGVYQRQAGRFADVLMLRIASGLLLVNTKGNQDALHVIVELHKEGLLQPVSRRSLAQQE